MSAVPRYRLTFCVLLFGVLSYTALQSLTIPTLPRIERELETTQVAVAWVLTAFLLSSSVATPILGRLGDSYGKKEMLIVCLGALSIGSLAAALAPNIEVMIAARAVQGIGGGALPLAFGIIRDEMPDDQVPRAVGLLSSLFAIGFGVGLVVAGPLVDLLGYHWLFLIPMLVAAASGLCVALLVPRTRVRTRERVPIIPGLLFGGWLLTFLLGVSKAPEWGWSSWQVMGLFVAALILMVLWIEVERRSRIPLIDLRMMRTRGVWTANVVALFTGMAMYGSLSIMPQFSQVPPQIGYGYGASASESGQLLLPMAVASFLSGLTAPQLTRRFSERAVIVVGASSVLAGLFLMLVQHDAPWKMAVSSGLLGLGTGAVFSCVALVVMYAVPQSQTGVATGMNANIRTVGGSIGSAISATLITAAVLPSGYPTEGGYSAAFALLAGAAVAAVLAALLIPRERRATAT